MRLDVASANMLGSERDIDLLSVSCVEEQQLLLWKRSCGKGFLVRRCLALSVLLSIAVVLLVR